MVKEDRSGWVAVEPQFAKGSASAEPPPIKPPTSAYNFFQKEQSSKIRTELIDSGQSADLGSLGRAISDRWKALDPTQRQVYEDMHLQDVMRFNRESHLRDVEVMRRREQQQKERDNVILETEDGLRTTRKGLKKEKRKKEREERKREKAERKKASKTSAAGEAFAADDVEFDDSSSSSESESYSGESESDEPGSSAKKKPARQVKQLSEAEQLRRNEARAAKAEKERYIEERQEELRQDRAAQAKRRLDFLLKQSDIFSHFGNVKEDHTKLGLNKNQQLAVAAKAKVDDGVVIGHRDRHSTAAAAEAISEEAELEEGDEHEATFLTAQPSTLGFGTMRPYQLEGLNWMIRLQENGVNGEY